MKRLLILALLPFSLPGCSDSSPVTLEFRIAEDEPGPGLQETIFEPTGERFYLHEEILLTQSDVDSAFAVRQDERWAVELLLTSAGRQEFEKLTESNVGKRCAMVLRGEVVTAPRIMAPIRVGRAILNGDFDEAEAKRIARALSQS